MKTVVLIIAQMGYQPQEYELTKEVLLSDNIKVVTASTVPDIAYAADGSTTGVDIQLDKIDPAQYDGIFLIGGPKALEYLDTDKVHHLLKEVALLHKPFGAICIAPRILAKAGLLKGKQATGWNEDSELLGIFKKYGVMYKPDAVVTDGTIVTAVDNHAAQDFGRAISALILNHNSK